MFVPFIYSHSISHERQMEIDKEKAHQSNIEYYSKLFKIIANNLSSYWFICPIEATVGGKMYAVNKKYLNVYMLIDATYNENTFKGNLVQECKFYIDDNHWQTIVVSDFVLMNNEMLNKLIDTAVNTYCKNTQPDEIPDFVPSKLENKLLYYTGKEYDLFDLRHIKRMDKTEYMKYYTTIKSIPENEAEFKVSNTYIVKFSKTTKEIIKNIKYCLTNPFVKYEIPKEKKEHNYINDIIAALIFIAIVLLIELFV